MTDGFRAGTDAEDTAGDSTQGFRGLKLYDTLAREKRDFLPIDWAAGSAVPAAARRVRMYVCGPTVYDFAHIGNARPVIVFDVLYRLLRHLYGPAHVTYVRNVTDVDDKINARAARDFPDLPLNEAIARVTATTEAQFHDDVAALGCLRPDQEPRATRHIEAMVEMIERLVAAGHAYVGDGHVLFDVASMPDYGRLSRRSTDDLIAGARVDVAPYKKGPMDFVLWKPSGPGEPGWPGPCGLPGLGRPGWHIECSAMSRAFLGDVFDIHGGGIDLVFPHHENELAQSRCALGTPAMANYWMHNGFLMVEGEKMSKSLGNFVTIRDVLKDWPGDVVRLNMLKTHYRQPIDWTVKRLDETRVQIFEWTKHLHNEYGEDASYSAPVDEGFIAALSDDLNTSLAIKRLQDMFGARASWGIKNASAFASTLAFLGLVNLRRPGFFQDGFEAKLVASGPQIDQETSNKIQSYRAVSANSAPFQTTSNAYSHLATEYLTELTGKGLLVDINDSGTLVVANKTGGEFEVEIEALVAARTAAKKAKNFAEADRIRDELKEKKSVQLKDGRDPATGEPVTTWEVMR